MRFKKALLIMFFSHIVLAEQADEIQFDALPDAVKKTALDYMDKKRIAKTTKISDDEHVKFEIETDRVENNKDIIAQDLVLSGTGKMMKLTQEVPYFTLPFELMKEIESHYPNIKVDEAESVQIHYFDVLGTVNNQKLNSESMQMGQ